MDIEAFHPMPAKFGCGITSLKPASFDGFRYEKVGRYHNYHCTPENWHWPIEYHDDKAYIIDGFSPNLNKQLHVGHLRNLALAASLQRFIPARFVALLGASLGIKKAALESWKLWTDFLQYTPQIFYRSCGQKTSTSTDV